MVQHMICKRYEGKVALVTGGASGIARATVLGLVTEGANVVFTDIASDAGQAYEAELKCQGSEVMFVRSDATSESDAEELIKRIVARYGRLDVAMNIVGNMGSSDKLGPMLHESTLEGWEDTIAISLTSAFLCMKHQLKQMMKQGNGGAIANTASLAGLRVTFNSSPGYVAAKSGLVHLSEYAAVMYAKHGIRVNVIAPGLTATPAVLDMFSAEQRDAMAAETQPMGRMMTPEELADAFLWVCSSQASAITGLTIPVDGGWAAR
jgi:NAD(P)-dependent dehydrogenase (short-subunit alcohol dehydrogenase family)